MAWRAARRQVWIAVGIVVLLIIALISLDAYYFNWQFTGFARKTLWDWLELLVIPVALAGIAYLFNRSEKRYELQIQEQRTATDRKIAEDAQQDATLQNYLDRITNLLLEKGLRNSHPDDEIRTVARSRTLTVLRRLDKERKGSILQFLYDSSLLSRDDTIIDLRGADLCGAEMSYAGLPRIALASTDLSDVALRGADLREANLSESKLYDADLLHAQLVNADLSETEAWRVELSFANLAGANLSQAVFRLARLLGADLSGAILTNATFMQAKLRKATLNRSDLRESTFEQADLAYAQLVEADLTEAVLTEADLTGTNLTKANLAGAMLTRAIYTSNTQWPTGFDPQAAGALLLDEASPSADQSSYYETEN
jgi:uncharacterized protein YjbI with pentapeptide repeats